MNKYIDAEKLIAEIERLNSLVSYESKDRHDEGLHDAYKAVKNVITSLQQEQPEVDLEKEVRIYCNSSFKFDYDELNDSFYSHAFEFDDVIELARHFYELGLNARKEE